MRIPLLALAPLLGFAASAWACLWYYGTGPAGEPKAVSARHPEGFVRELTDRREHDRRKQAPLGGDPGPQGDFKLRSDFAASLVYRGEAARAAALFEEIERAHPGEYVVASNLGTAYELAGDDEKALNWISEGLKRNPKSHAGTEWLHVRILEAKLALKKDPDWLGKHSVLGVDFGKDPVPTIPASLPKEREPGALSHALEYQLHERLGFVDAPDAVCADLLFDLGNLAAHLLTAEHAAAVYELALRYGPANPELVRARLDRMKALSDERSASQRTRRRLQMAVPLGVAAAALLAGLVLALRRRRRPSGL